MNLSDIQTIGAGAYFPITLETKLDSQGNPEKVKIIKPDPNPISFQIDFMEVAKVYYNTYKASIRNEGDSHNNTYILPNANTKATVYDEYLSYGINENPSLSRGATPYLVKGTNNKVFINKTPSVPDNTTYVLSGGLFQLNSYVDIENIDAPNWEAVERNANMGLWILDNTESWICNETENSAYLTGVTKRGILTLGFIHESNAKFDTLYLSHQGHFYHLTINAIAGQVVYLDVPLEHDETNSDDKVYFFVDTGDTDASYITLRDIKFESTAYTEEEVDKIGWYLMSGKIELINQNLRAIIATQLGQMLRNEYFGTRIWECIEEPNTQAIAFLVRRFLKGAIESWEPRLKFLESTLVKSNEKLYIKMRYQVKNNQSVEELNFSYDPKTNNIDIQ